MQIFKFFPLTPSLYLKVYADEENGGDMKDNREYTLL